MQPDEQGLGEEKKMARYSKTAEFKRIQDHFKQRIAFYQTHLPDGRPLVGLGKQRDLGKMWMVANLVITELEAVINIYEQAAEAVEEAESDRK